MQFSWKTKNALPELKLTYCDPCLRRNQLQNLYSSRNMIKVLFSTYLSQKRGRVLAFAILAKKIVTHIFFCGQTHPFHLQIWKLLFPNSCSGNANAGVLSLAGTVAVWTQKNLSTIDAPPGVPGVSRDHIYFFTNETVFLLR